MSAAFESLLAELSAAVPLGVERPRVYVQVWDRPPRVAEAWMARVLQATGAVPFLTPPGSTDRDVSWEELLEFDPQMVLYIVEGQGTSFDPAALMAIEGWNRCEAARMQRLFSLDDGLFKEGEQVQAGALLVQKLLREQFWGGPRIESAQLRRYLKPM